MSRRRAEKIARRSCRQERKITSRAERRIARQELNLPIDLPIHDESPTGLRRDRTRSSFLREIEHVCPRELQGLAEAVFLDGARCEECSWACVQFIAEIVATNARGAVRVAADPELLEVLSANTRKIGGLTLPAIARLAEAIALRA